PGSRCSRATSAPLRVPHGPWRCCLRPGNCETCADQYKSCDCNVNRRILPDLIYGRNAHGTSTEHRGPVSDGSAPNRADRSQQFLRRPQSLRAREDVILESMRRGSEFGLKRSLLVLAVTLCALWGGMPSPVADPSTSPAPSPAPSPAEPKAA